MTQQEWTKEQIATLERAPDVPDVLLHGMQQATGSGLWLEFGVAGGASLARIATHVRGLPAPRPVLAGFDSFKGLPEDWVWNHSQKVPKGHFAQDVIPVIPGAEIVVGLFGTTLRPWLKRAKKRGHGAVTFVHVDCDLYSSAAVVLEEVGPLLAEGAIVVFDELVGYHGFDHHEWRALYEAHDVHRMFGFEWLARRAGGQQASLRVTGIKAPSTVVDFQKSAPKVEEKALEDEKKEIA